MLQTRIKNRLIRRGIVALALLATLPGIPVAAGQAFDEAVAAYGRGDYATAVRVFLVHAEQGDASAQFSLGVMYANGEGVLKDEAEAVRWYRLAAEQGHADAQFNLGVMYANGRGVLKDEAEAVRWSRLAAEQGHAGAQFNLGVMYANGEGVLKDEAKAVRWYRLAAEQGHAGAQFNLGVMYANGEGVLKDEAEAVRWYRLAAEQGHADAQFNLGVMYANGEGVLKDEAEAVRWSRYKCATRVRPPIPTRRRPTTRSGQQPRFMRLGRVISRGPKNDTASRATPTEEEVAMKRWLHRRKLKRSMQEYERMTKVYYEWRANQELERRVLFDKQDANAAGLAVRQILDHEQEQDLVVLKNIIHRGSVATSSDLTRYGFG